MKPNRVESIWDEVRSELERRKAQLYDEIRTYPPPITACDQQFDHLLAQQQRISRELDRMEAAWRASLSDRDPAASIEAFLRSSPWVSDEATERIRSLLIQAARPREKD